MLSLLVAAMHALNYAGIHQIDFYGRSAVWVFFIISGCVLSRSWDGRFGLFLIRRVIRLWPVHLVCLALCWCLLRTPVHLFDVFLFPWLISSRPSVFVTHLANQPTWSLCIELGAALFMPAIAFCGRHGLLGLLGGVVGSFALAIWVYPPCLDLGFFVLGAAFSGVPRLPCRFLEGKFPQWLGKISYSLYLAHAPIFDAAAGWFGPFGPL